MKRVYVNEKWCLGCHLCEYNCAFANSGEKNMAEALKGKPIFPRIHIEGDEKISYAVSCRHCRDPICVKSCIAGAISSVDGVVIIDRNKCVGCHTCILGCQGNSASSVSGRRNSRSRYRLPLRSYRSRTLRTAHPEAQPCQHGGRAQEDRKGAE